MHSTQAAIRACLPANGVEPAQRLIRLPEVLSITGLSRSTAYSLIRERRFPAPIPLEGRARVWVAAEVVGWVNAKIEAARSGVGS